ncbi:MAG TPA: tetratricopeptide repeat protein [Myxococcota bacterium]|jgi:hypothetical protein|nr:tetratricopeptide repeat protein [Myxococcota bacterium]
MVGTRRPLVVAVAALALALLLALGAASAGAAGKGKGKGKGKGMGKAGATAAAAAPATGAASGAPLTATSATAPALAPVPDEFDRLYDEAQSLYTSGNYKAALAAYEKAYAIRPEPEPLFGIARCYHQLGRLEEATEHYEHFLTAAPTHSGGPRTRALLIEALGAMGAKALGLADWTKAADSYRRGLKYHDPTDPARTDATSGMLLAGLGEALAELGPKEEAIATLNAALAAELTPELRARTDKTLHALTAPPPKKSRSPLLFVGIGGGAALVLGGVAAVLFLFVLPKPFPTDTDLGVFDVALRGAR